MTDAAAGFLAALDEDQRTLASWPFPADDERQRWFYTPTDHGGLPLGSMRPSLQRLTMKLLATGLSRPGYVAACSVIGLENILDELEGWNRDFDRERGRDPGLYYLRVFGDPLGSGPWSWRFGGHHVSVQHVVAGGAVRASTPSFLGAHPARTPMLGSDVLRPLGSVEDLARDLVTSLTAEQRERAILSSVAPTDVVGGNRPRLVGGELPLRLPDVWRARFQGAGGAQLESQQADAEMQLGLQVEHLEAVRLTLEPKGVSAGELDSSGRELLRTLLAAHIGRIPDELAEAEMAKFAGDGITALSFAWAGATALGEPHYYRIQGPRILIEYDNTQGNANHIHAVWRDPGGDFGGDLLSDHYSTVHGANQSITKGGP